jgi:hypothetical protein
MMQSRNVAITGGEGGAGGRPQGRPWDLKDMEALWALWAQMGV